MPNGSRETGTYKMNDLIDNIEKLHTTVLGAERIKRNLSIEADDVVQWCKTKILNPYTVITRRGKNWYADIDDCEITVNAQSYTIITAHKITRQHIL